MHYTDKILILIGNLYHVLSDTGARLIKGCGGDDTGANVHGSLQKP